MFYSKKVKKLKTIFFLLSLIFAIISYSFMNYLKDSYLKTELDKKTSSYLKIYKTVYDQYEELSEVFYSGILELNKLDEKLKRYQETSNEKEKSLIRESVYKKIDKRYKKLKEKHLTSINIVLPDNRFFLSMRNPSKFDFKASKYRTDLKLVNETRQRLDSFSIGLKGSGYRYIFPIFNKNQYVGLISFTFDASAITSNIMKQYPVLSNFYTKEESFDKNFLKKSKQYVPSHHEGYLYNKEVLKVLKKYSSKEVRDLILEKSTVKKVFNNFQERKINTVFDKKSAISITTIPVINKTDDKTQAILIIRSKASEINSYVTMINTISILIILFIFLFFYLLYKLTSEKEVLANEVKEKTKELEFLNNSLEKNVKEKTEKLVKSNQELLEQKEFLNTLIQCSPNPIFFKNCKGEYLDVNKSWSEFTGFTREEIINKSVYDVAPKEIADIYYEQDQKVFKLEENPQIYESKVINKVTKQEYDVMFYKSAYFDDNGEVKGLIGTLLDLTQMKHLEDEKINREKLILDQAKFAQMGEMIENIAHQWRQPLSLISTISSGIKLNFEFDTFNKESAINDLNTLIKTSNHLSETIDHFRDFIKEKRELRIVTVQERIQSVLTIVDASLKNNHIEVIKDIDNSNSLEIELVLGELSQVLINLINNSKDALQLSENSNKWIKITCEKKNSFAKICIEDNAGGVPKDIISKIFNPYFTTKHQYKGTGIGLYMSKNIIEKQLKGNIYVSNTENGAKFCIEIPLID